MNIVNVVNLKKSFGNEFTAVNDISFSIISGEIFGFLGPNGAGKTTTINMMIGLAKPTAGTITIDGFDIVKETKSAQSVMGIVADESNLYDEMSGFDNLCFCASLYGMPKHEREVKARELLELFDLAQAGKRRYKAYSKGMKRRLTIAAGIIHSPKILFLDEPTTGIDVESARQIRDLIKTLKDNGTTVFMTTHYLEDAERICDRIAFIAKGKIVKTGTVKELLQAVKIGHTVQIASIANIAKLDDELSKAFPDFRFTSVNENTINVSSENMISLLPILNYLDSQGIPVHEAKELQPNLEDVFVQLTGIDSKSKK